MELKIRADFLCPSGADIMSFCRDAALMSMRKVIKDKSPEEIKLLSKNDLEKPVTMDDFNEGNLLKGIVNWQGVWLNLLSRAGLL